MAEQRLTPEQINSILVGNPVAEEMLKRDESQFRDAVTALYRQHGYDSEGNDLPAAQVGLHAISKATGVPDWLTTAMAATPIPAVTTAVGAAVAGYPGAMVGSELGEEANAALGITEPLTTTGRVVAAAAPGLPIAGRFAKQQIGHYLTHRAPGAGFGAHEALQDTVAQQFAKHGIAEAAENAAWQSLRESHKFNVSLPKTIKFLSSRLSELELRGGMGLSTVGSKQIDGILNQATQTGYLDKNRMMALFHYANEQKRKPGQEWWGKVAGSIVDDMEAFAARGSSTETGTAVTEGVKRLKAATAATRRRTATEDFTNLMNKSTTQLTNDNSIKFNRDTFIKGLTAVEGDETKNVFQKGFGDAEVKEIIDSVRNLGYIIPNPEMSASTIGREMLPIASVASAVGGGTGLWMPVMGAGVAFGVLSRVILSGQTGRNWVKRTLMEQGGRLSVVQIQEMAAALSGAGLGALRGAQAGSQRNPASPVTPFPMEE